MGISCLTDHYSATQEVAREMVFSMSNFSLVIPQGYVRSFRDPIDAEISHHRVLVDVQDLSQGLPKGANPRDVWLRSGVAKSIKQSLMQRDGNFHLLNRGITIICDDCKYDTKTQQLTVKIDDESGDQGILDGFHTYTIIQNALASDNWCSVSNDEVSPQFVWLEIISNAKNPLDIVEARNNSVPVRSESMDNLNGYFERIKRALAGKVNLNLIGFNENANKADDSSVVISVKDVVRLMTLFNVSKYDKDNHPVKAYSALAAVLRDFEKECEKSKEMGDDVPKPETYSKLESILPDILKLRDYLYNQYPDYYAKSSVCSNPKNARFGALSEIKKAKKPLYFLDNNEVLYSEYDIPNGFVLPILSALRCLVEFKNGEASWRCDPFEFLDHRGPAFVGTILEFSRLLKDPNAVGKARPVWGNLYRDASFELTLDKGK